MATKEQDEELAEQHWKWLGELLHRLYVDAFLHGAKHAEERVKDE